MNVLEVEAGNMGYLLNRADVLSLPMIHALQRRATASASRGIQFEPGTAEWLSNLRPLPLCVRSGRMAGAQDIEELPACNFRFLLPFVVFHAFFFNRLLHCFCALLRRGALALAACRSDVLVVFTRYFCCCGVLGLAVSAWRFGFGGSGIPDAPDHLSWRAGIRR